MEWTFEGSIIYWRGPAPFYFVPLSEDVVADLAPVANQLTYGWGCIPVQATIGDTAFDTALFPKDGGYLLPLKNAVRSPQGLSAGSDVTVEMTVRL